MKDFLLTLVPRNILARLNLSAPHFRHQHHNALFLSNVFVKITYPSILDTVSLHVPSNITGDHSIFTTHLCAKASPSARFVTAANAVCCRTGIFSHHGISQKYLIPSNSIDPIIISLLPPLPWFTLSFVAYSTYSFPSTY